MLDQATTRTVQYYAILHCTIVLSYHPHSTILFNTRLRCIFNTSMLVSIGHCTNVLCYSILHCSVECSFTTLTLHYTMLLYTSTTLLYYTLSRSVGLKISKCSGIYSCFLLNFWLLLICKRVGGEGYNDNNSWDRLKFRSLL